MAIGRATIRRLGGVLGAGALLGGGPTVWSPSGNRTAARRLPPIRPLLKWALPFSTTLPHAVPK